MVLFNVDCPKCWKARWHATGRFNENRHGLRRAECVCDACGYAFSSGRPEAIAAGEAVIAAGSQSQAEWLPPLLPTQPTVSPTGRQPVRVGALANDWKLKQAGDTE